MARISTVTQPSETTHLVPFNSIRLDASLRARKKASTIKKLISDRLETMKASARVFLSWKSINNGNSYEDVALWTKVLVDYSQHPSYTQFFFHHINLSFPPFAIIILKPWPEREFVEGELFSINSAIKGFLLKFRNAREPRRLVLTRADNWIRILTTERKEGNVHVFPELHRELGIFWPVVRLSRRDYFNPAIIHLFIKCPGLYPARLSPLQQPDKWLPGTLKENDEVPVTGGQRDARFEQIARP